MTTGNEAYRDGIDAGWRTGRYLGIKSPANCPYAVGTVNNELWWDAFGCATEDLIAMQNSET